MTFHDWQSNSINFQGMANEILNYLALPGIPWHVRTLTLVKKVTQVNLLTQVALVTQVTQVNLVTQVTLLTQVTRVTLETLLTLVTQVTQKPWLSY